MSGHLTLQSWALGGGGGGPLAPGLAKEFFFVARTRSTRC